MTQTAERRKALFTRATTEALIEALITVEEQPSTQERNLCRDWLIEELERRFPTTDDLVEQAFAEADAREQETGERVDVNYTFTLIEAIRSVQA